MNHGITHSTEVILEREDRDIPVLLTIVWSYSRGEYVEPGHSRNGYGRGYWCRKLEAEDVTSGEVVPLTRHESDHFMEKFHPTNIP